MFKPTVDAASDAASVLFNLPEYRDAAVTRDERGGRRCSSRPWSAGRLPVVWGGHSPVHQRTMQRVRDVPFDGQVTVWWVKKRWRCGESLCGKATFTEHTDQVPPYARLTTRSRNGSSRRCLGRSAAWMRSPPSSGVSWPTAMR